MYYNDVPDHIQCYEVIMYADHRVVFYANKDPTVIENRLNNDMGNVKNFCLPKNLQSTIRKKKPRLCYLVNQNVSNHLERTLK